MLLAFFIGIVLCAINGTVVGRYGEQHHWPVLATILYAFITGWGVMLAVLLIGHAIVF